MILTTLDNFLQEVKFVRKKELMDILEKITLIQTLNGMGNFYFDIWGKQRLEQVEYVEAIYFNLMSISFYISKKTKDIRKIEFHAKRLGNFDDLFFDTMQTSIRNAMPDGSCQAYLFAIPLSVLSEQDILDFCNKILLFRF
jgi:hypothetical protein